MCVAGTGGTEQNSQERPSATLPTVPYSTSLLVHQHFLAFHRPLLDHRLIPQWLQPPAKDDCERIEDLPAITAPRSTPLLPTHFTHSDFRRRQSILAAMARLQYSIPRRRCAHPLAPVIDLTAAPSRNNLLYLSYLLTRRGEHVHFCDNENHQFLIQFPCVFIPSQCTFSCLVLSPSRN